MVNVARVAARATAAAFKVTAGLQKQVTLVLKPAEGDFNLETGKRDAGATAPIVLPGLFYHNAQKKDSDDTSKRATILLQKAVVISLGYAAEIQTADAAEVDGVRWNIEQVVQDPAGATYQLLCRI